MESQPSSFTIQRRRDLLHVAFDRPDKSVNAFSRAVLAELNQVLDEVARDATAKGVIFSSRKSGSFIVGADVDEIQTIATADEARAFTELGQQVFERLSQLRVPSVALISGACLGGGLEFALACTYRIADLDRKTSLGFPEVRLGLIPGWGGTVRLPRLVGLPRAMRMITTGQSVASRQAKSMGLVNDAVPSEALFDAGEQWLRAPFPVRPRSWIERAVVATPAVKPFLFGPVRRAVEANTHGHYPAPKLALDVLEAGLAGPSFGFAAERDAIAQLATSPVTRELVRLFLLAEQAKHRVAELVRIDPLADPPDCALGRNRSAEIESVGVLGAGIMGAGLARLFAEQRIAVRLKDVSPDALSRGLKSIQKISAQLVERKRITSREADQIHRRISPTADGTGFRQAALILEAIVEDASIKQGAFVEIERRVSPETVFATNTSSLTVAEIAAGLEHPERLVGLHFFNPPHRMPLVEIVRSAATSDHALSVAARLARQLGKTPVVVGDCAGFLVNRLLAPYMNEAGYLLSEVDDPLEIERAAVEFGFPMGPLELLDLVGLGVATKVAERMHQSYGERMQPAPLWLELKTLAHAANPTRPLSIMQKRWTGKKGLNPAIAGVAHRLRARRPTEVTLSRSEIADRLVFPVINEAALCLAEGIAANADDIDLAMVLGTGFAPFRGGPMRYAAAIGLDKVVADLERWSREHPRLRPSDALRAMA